MDALEESFRQKHGVLRRSDLIKVGVDDDQIKQGVRTGLLKRVRRGWYKHSDVEVTPIIEAAVNQGCAYSGDPALALHGAWNLHRQHVYLRTGRMHHNRGPATPTVLRRSNGRYVPVEAAVDPVELAFEVALVKLDASDLIVVGDSIVQRGLLTITEIDEIAASYPPRIRAAVRRINGFAESGTETLVRLWLEEMRIPFVQQFMFRDSQRADFLLGRGLILEVDSVAHHASREQQQKDYNRDQYLRGLGYVVFRVTYDDVMRNWKFASEQLMLIIQRGEHLKIPAFRRGAR